MENAILIQNFLDLENFDSSVYSRIVFGNEYCEELIPDLLEVDAVIKFISYYGVSLTFLTPPSTEKGLTKLKEIFAILPDETEVVFNDWGVFNLLNDYKLNKVFGKILMKAKKDPRIANLEEKSISEINRTILTKDFQEFLISNDVFRVELDNANYKYNINNIDPRIKTTLYYPMVYVSSTRKCYSENYFFEGEKKRLNSNCNFSCATTKFNIKIDGIDSEIKGNTIFYINKNKTNIGLMNLDRLVFVQKYPFMPGYYQRWDSYYKCNKYYADRGYTNPDKHVVDFINYYEFEENLKVLDIGCGLGKNSKFFLEKNFETYGIDISKNAVEHSRMRNPSGWFFQMNAVNLKFNKNFFDIIIDAGCLHVNPKIFWKIIVDEYENVLKKGGKLFVRLFTNEGNKRQKDDVLFKVNEDLNVYSVSKKEIYGLFYNFKVEKIIFDENYEPFGVYYVYLIKK